MNNKQNIINLLRERLKGGKKKIYIIIIWIIKMGKDIISKKGVVSSRANIM